MTHHITDHDINEFLVGRHAQLYKIFGSHLLRDEEGNIHATRFTVYAPHAKEVRLISSHNQYESWKHIFTKIHHCGIFTITISENLEWATYKYEFHLQNGSILHKSDPFAHFAEERPQTGSKVYDINYYHWSDQGYLFQKKKSYQEPILIYEVHLGSWQQTFGRFKKYNEVVDALIKYVKDQGFTHVELMPVYEHPLDDSWGYQGTGFFAATSRYGVPKDLMYFVDRMHQEGIGVIMDWVLGHICKDAHGISYFDGTPLFEFEDAFRRENVEWGTSNLDFSKGITRSFMLSALNFWHTYFHVDGYRIDAVSNLIYYLGNRDHGVNHDAINFIKQLSYFLYGKDDRILLMAEDSTDYPQVTHPISDGGVGFNYKWNMGFMNDVLRYFKEDPINRKFHHDKITFGLVYAFNEQFILPFSHDEVVHMKGSLIQKMPGDYWQKFANWRLLMTLWITHPGKKLLFMGQEFAQFSEWDFKKELDWQLYAYPAHQKANRFFRDLVSVYKHHEAFYKYDHDPKTFSWLVVDDKEQSIFSYIRQTEDQMMIVLLNMTPNVHRFYDIGVPHEGEYEEILNSDKTIYDGSDQYNGVSLKTIKGTRNGFDQFIPVLVGPLAGIILKYKK